MNTGSASAFEASSASATVASVVSAPSVTSTSPETGSPASSWRALSIALASRVCVPPNVRSAGALTRAVDEEKRNVRMRNRSDSAFIIGAVGIGERLCATRSAREPACVFDAGSCMLRESSIRMPTTFCCATAALTTSTGRKMQNRMMRERGHAQHAEHRPLAPLHARCAAAVADERDRQRRDDDGSRHRRPGRRGETEVTLAEDVGPVLEEELKQGLEHGWWDSIVLRRRV